MLVGNILLVTPHEVWKCFALFVAVGVFHFLLRRNFLLVSFDRGAAYQKGLRVRWDFVLRVRSPIRRRRACPELVAGAPHSGDVSCLSPNINSRERHAHH